MPDYKKMYFSLAAKVADAIDVLIEAQQTGEDAAMDADVPLLTLDQEETGK